PPPAPSDLSVAPGVARVAVSWSDLSSSEQGFKVERKDGSSGAWRQIATVGANASRYVDDHNLKAGVSYYYRVRAYNAAGTSASSVESPAARVEISSITWQTGAPSP